MHSRTKCLTVITATWALAVSTPAAAQDSLTGPLIVSTAGSMGPAFKQILTAFVKRHPGIVPVLRTGGSVIGAQQVVDSAPDVFVSADDTLIDVLLMPRYATWHARFARSPMVLAYTTHSHYADQITPQNWAQTLMKPGVHAIRGNPEQDPGAYRTLMIFALADEAAHSKTLTNSLSYAVAVTDSKNINVSALFDSGGVDYMFMYRASAIAHQLKWVELPPSINLGDPAQAALYASAQVLIPSGVPGAPDTVAIHGAPVMYGLTVPVHAPHQTAALAFAAFALGAQGRAALTEAQFEVLPKPEWRGKPPQSLMHAVP